MTGVHALALLAGVLAALGAHAQGLALPVWPLAGGLLLYAASRLRPLATLCGGFLWACWPLQQYDHARLEPEFDARVLVIAQLEGLPLRRGADETFTAMLRPVHAGSLPAPQLRALLRWRGAKPLRAGERWQLLVALHAVPSAINPGSATAALHSLRLRLHGEGQVVDSALNRRLSPGKGGLDVWREKIALAIAAQVDERDAAALIIALAIGDTQRVAAEQWRVFNAVGVTHLIAISGLHVTLFCLLMAGLAGVLWRRSAWLAACVPRHTFGAVIGLAAAFGYALLAGWSVPTQRTLLMLIAWHGLKIAARPRSAARTLTAGLFGVLLFDPLAPLAAGFWLSFIAVGALLLRGAVTPSTGQGWRALVRTQCYVAVALLPATVAVFGSISLAGLAVNLVAIPVFTLLLVPLILAATAALGLWSALAAPLLKMTVMLIGVLWPLLHAVAESPVALLRVAPPVWWYPLAAAATAVLLLPWRPWLRCTSLLALVPAAWPASAMVAAGSFTATVFDAGSGEAVLLRTARHALLYDNGEVWGTGGATTAARVVPALRYYNVRSLDVVMLPRVDHDRGAGVLALAAAMPTVKLAAAAGRDLPPEFLPCESGARWRWDGVEFDLLDGASCALRVSVEGNALLLPGAADAGAQARRLLPVLSPTSVVLVPGHGSAAARQPALIVRTAPRLALLSATALGARSASIAATLRMWREAGVPTHVTGIDGALELQFEPGGRIGLLRWQKP